MLQTIGKQGMRFSIGYYEGYASTIIALGRRFLSKFQFTYSKWLLRWVPSAIGCFVRTVFYKSVLIQRRSLRELSIIKHNGFNFFNTGTLLYARLDLIFTDGLLIDNLQKKLYDTGSRKFLIFSVYLFNDRGLFERISRGVLDQLVGPTREILYVDGFSVATAVHPILFGFFFSFVILNLAIVASYCSTISYGWAILNLFC